MNAASIPSPSPDVRRRWARQLLDLPAEAGPEGSAGDVLQRLQDAEFVPSESWRQAMQTLIGSPGVAGSGTPSPHAPDRLLSHGEEEVRGDVEAFAAQFFRLEPGPRRQRWQQLRSSPGLTPAMALRLDALAEGLSLDEKLLGGDQADLGELANLAARFSVLRPRERAQLRRQKLTELSADAPRWQRAAARLERDRPALAALAPDLLRGLKGSVGSDKHPATPLFAPNTTSAAPAPARVQTSGSSKGSTWWIWIVIVALMSLFRGMSSMNSPPSPSTTPVPNYRPMIPPLPDGKSLETFEERVRRQLQDSESKSQDLPADAARRAYLRLMQELRKQQEQEKTGSPAAVPGVRPGEATRRLFDDYERPPSSSSSSPVPPSNPSGKSPSRP